MTYGLLADFVVIVHLAFIAFVLLGGLLAVRWPACAWVHVPSVIWAGYIELTGTICPLTPLERLLRSAAGERGYQGHFIDQYILPVIYPSGLTPSMQVMLGALTLAVNAGIYAAAWMRKRRS
jgi:hypothetical protein